MNMNLAITGLAAIAAIGAVVVPTQRSPSLSERLGTINNQINARQAMPSTDRGMLVMRYDSDGVAQPTPVTVPTLKPNKGTPGTGSAAVIMEFSPVYAPFTNFQGGFYYGTVGQVLSYATASSNAPQNLVAGENAADAVAACYGAGITNVVFANHGYLILAK